jgi:uncharacterized protein (DUF433 family)
MPENLTPKKGIQAEMLVGMSAVVIGVCALGVSFYETSLMREEQRAAVLPLLELARSYYIDNIERDTSKWRLSLHAENVGIGPARVRDFIVTVDGQPHPTWRSAMKTLIGRNIDVSYGQSSINGRTIPAERLVTMFELSSTELAGEIIANFDRLEFEACFCSVFEECWTTSFSSFGTATPIEACVASQASFTE